MPTSTAVLVVGAGPAGALLALQLAHAGVAVTLADRRDSPRDKPCGEFLSPQCLPYLAERGLGGLLTRLHSHRVTGMRLAGFGRGAQGIFRALPGRGDHAAAGFGLRRAVFDHQLVQAAIAAGVRWLPRHAFAGLRRDGERVAGAYLVAPDGARLEVPARWTVGADGVHSPVARALGVQRRIAWLDQFALVAHFTGMPPDDHAAVQVLSGGFAAGTTVDQGLFAFNLVLPRRLLRARTAADWDEFVTAQLGPSELAKRLTTGERCTPWHGTGPFGFRTTSQVAAGAALVGDAAGYVDPMTGEGIYFALFGARALGNALLAALADPARAAAALDGYARERARELAPRLAASRVLQRIIRHPWLVRASLRAVRCWPGLADLVVTLTGDTVHPRELLRPSFWRDFRSAG